MQKNLGVYWHKRSVKYVRSVRWQRRVYRNPSRYSVMQRIMASAIVPFQVHFRRHWGQEFLNAASPTTTYGIAGMSGSAIKGLWSAKR